MVRRLHLSARFAAALLGLAVWGSAIASNESIAIIVAKDSPETTLDNAALRDIYLKKIFIDENGQSLVPVNLPPTHPLRRALVGMLFNKSAQQLQDYWNQRYFHGITPPYVLDSQAAVIQFVAKTPGAIGYVAACHLNASVKTVLTLPVPAGQRDAIEKLCNGEESATE